jgi:cytochrome c peroxidase
LHGAKKWHGKAPLRQGEINTTTVKKYTILIIIIVAITFTQASFINNEPANKAELGRLLFFDSILSKDKTISCASCHKPEFAFADTSPVSIGVGSAKGVRNTPSAMNVRLQRAFFK